MRWPWQRKSTASEPGTWEVFRAYFQAMSRTKSGASVTAITAMECTAVMACARLVANGLAQVPLKVYRADGGKRLPANDHPLYWLLHRQPNAWQTSFQWRQTVGLHLMLCGDHVSFVNRSRGQIVEIIPFDPRTVRLSLAQDGYERRYGVTLPNGEQITLTADQVFHVSGPSWCAWKGLEPVRLAREAIGLSLAIEGEQASLFSNGIQSSGTYSVEGTLDKEQHEALRNYLTASYSGENRGAPMIVDRSAKWQPHRLNNVDAQTADSRRFQVQEVARAMGVLPLMIGLDDKSNTFASAEQMFVAHVVHTLGPWYECLEQAMDVQLLGVEDASKGYYAKHVVQGLMRGSMKDRAEYLAKGLGAGGSPAWLTQDEAREIEELNPMGGAAGLLREPTNVASKAPDSTPTT